MKKINLNILIYIIILGKKIKIIIFKINESLIMDKFSKNHLIKYV